MQRPGRADDTRRLFSRASRSVQRTPRSPRRKPNLNWHGRRWLRLASTRARHRDRQGSCELRRVRRYDLRTIADQQLVDVRLLLGLMEPRGQRKKTNAVLRLAQRTGIEQLL